MTSNRINPASTSPERAADILVDRLGTYAYREASNRADRAINLRTDTQAFYEQVMTLVERLLTAKPERRVPLRTRIQRAAKERRHQLGIDNRAADLREQAAGLEKRRRAQWQRQQDEAEEWGGKVSGLTPGGTCRDLEAERLVREVARPAALVRLERFARVKDAWLEMGEGERIALLAWLSDPSRRDLWPLEPGIRSRIFLAATDPLLKRGTS
jgi:hypothetical protein